MMGNAAGSSRTRILRARHSALSDQVDRVYPIAPSGTPRRLVQIYNAGAMPSSPDHFFAAYPIELDGIETEGGTAAAAVDPSQTIVVNVLGHPPSVGEILTAYAVGGRWVSERGASSGSGSITCSPCNIPTQNLTLSWVNAINGNGSTTLTYVNTPTSWTSACANGLLYELLCNSGQLELRVIYFTTGACPTGTQQYCSNLRTAPFGLSVSSFSCTPFSLTLLSRSSGCPTITNSGYTRFTITV
jgi:hypothetical protein